MATPRTNPDRESLIFENKNDLDGNPAGGFVQGVGLDIRWQDGPLGPPKSPDRLGQNGTFVEDVIQAAIIRIAYYQNSKFHCLENAVALGHLHAALEALTERTRERTDRNVEGTHQQ